MRFFSLFSLLKSKVPKFSSNFEFYAESLHNIHFLRQDDIIYIHRHWVLDGERKALSRNLHMQFHGREMHSICFVSEELQPGVTGRDHLFDRSSWIATGCEDGTVRLTRYGYYYMLFRI